MSDQAVIDEAAAMADLERRRSENRASFPSVTAIVDEFRLYFGYVKVLGGRDFVTGKEFGWNPPPSPNCDSCTGHNGGLGCDRMDRVVYGHDKPEPSKVFCGYRLKSASPINKPNMKAGQRR
jgi:hypothetical protein